MEKKGFAHDSEHTHSAVKHGGARLLAWACMLVSGIISLMFINDGTHDGSSRENSRESFCLPLYREMPRLIWRNFIMQQDNDPKHSAKSIKDFIRGEISGRI